MSEWLRRWTRNPLGSAREGSNPFGVVFMHRCRGSRDTQHENMRRPGIEPGPSAWKADILTTRPTTLLSFRDRHLWVLRRVRCGYVRQKNPDTRNRTRDHLIPTDSFYSQTLYQLSYVRLLQWFPSFPGRCVHAQRRTALRK